MFVSVQRLSAKLIQGFLGTATLQANLQFDIAQNGVVFTASQPNRSSHIMNARLLTPCAFLTVSHCRHMVFFNSLAHRRTQTISIIVEARNVAVLF